MTIRENHTGGCHPPYNGAEASTAALHATGCGERPHRHMPLAVDPETVGEMPQSAGLPRASVRERRVEAGVTPRPFRRVLVSTTIRTSRHAGCGFGALRTSFIPPPTGGDQDYPSDGRG